MSSHTADTALTFLGKLILEGEIHCQTGLHIGAGKGSLEIAFFSDAELERILQILGVRPD